MPVGPSCKQIENSHTEECSNKFCVCVLIEMSVILPIR